MVHDRYFYDPVAHRYTVDRYLDDLEKRYGGIDAVLIWPTYPNMGIDDRNQHDMVRSMPGGVAGVRQMVADFHRRGVHVLFPMMMWDQGTRDPASPGREAIAELMKEIGRRWNQRRYAGWRPAGLFVAAEQIGHPLAFEPEGGPADEALAWNVMNWGQYQVSVRSHCRSLSLAGAAPPWSTSTTAGIATRPSDLQFAFFNGEGWESWENVWGIWNGITPRDAEATRRVATIERAVAPFLVSKDWEPLYPMLRLWRLRQPLAARQPDRLDDRQSQRITTWMAGR